MILIKYSQNRHYFPDNALFDNLSPKPMFIETLESNHKKNPKNKNKKLRR